MYTFIIRFFTSVTAALAALCLGCQHPDQPGLDGLSPEAFTEVGSDPLKSDWWTAFDSAELDNLVSEAFEGNFNLAISYERLVEARAISRQSSASLWPFLNVEADGRTQDPDFPDGDVLEAGLTAGYEIDLWGRVRSSAKAGELRANASESDFAAAALSLSAEVVRTWVRLLIVEEQGQLLSRQEKANEQILFLLQNRFASGQIQRVDVLRQEQLLEDTRSQLHRNIADTAVLKNQLNVLLGRPISEEVQVSDSELPPIPPLPATGLPGDLVQRRPDIRAAYNRLRAADYSLASAVADRFPSISLRASLLTEESDSVNLFDDWFRSLAGNILLPVIDGGRRRAAVEEAEAVKRQTLYAYGQEILEAFQEVEDALIQESQQAERLGSLTRQFTLAEEALEQLQRQYRNGVSNYLDVLTSLNDKQRLERELLSEKLALYEFRIALYRSLAGPFPVDYPNPLN